MNIFSRFWGDFWEETKLATIIENFKDDFIFCSCFSILNM